MPVYQRHQVATLLRRLAESPERLIVLSGPRQTGKTTLVRQVLDQITAEKCFVAADEPPPEPAAPYDRHDPGIPYAERQDTTRERAQSRRNQAWLERIWQEARRAADRSTRGFVLVLDEIQKVPQWSEAVKGLWDTDRAARRHMHVVILGSAPLLMQQGLNESLAGRFELIRVNHWSFREMVGAFDFDLPTYLYYGGYPGAAEYVKDEPRWRDYIRSSLIEPNVEKDILSLTRVNKPALLKRAFEVGSIYSGQILSYTKMQGHLRDAGNTTTLAHYLDLLSSAGLLTSLSKYDGLKHRRRAASPKLNVLNTAFMSVMSGYSFAEAQSDRTFWGRLVESAVGAHLVNTGVPDLTVHYWRHSPHEVDFVLEKGKRLIAIEVKSGQHRKTGRGMATFQERFHPQRILLVGSDGVSLDEFLTHPADHWFESL